MNFRNTLKPADVAAIRDILHSTGFFYDSEIEIAEELANENLKLGAEKSEYYFDVAETDGQPVGFTCYGKIPGTADSFDLYWIAVHQSQRGKGLGKQLMQRAEKAIAGMAGKNIWIETSSREIYESTRQFYLKAHCVEIARLPDFYGENDDKVIYLKRV